MRHERMAYGAGRSGRGAALLAAGGLLAAAAGVLAGCATGPGRAPAIAAARPACTDVVFPIYFAQKSDQLTPGADQVIGSAVAQVKGCRIGYVSVLGLTDSNGDRQDNLELSRRRAATVAAALKSAGLVTPRFNVEGVGETGAVSEKGRPVPLRRKTEVVIHPLPN